MTTNSGWRGSTAVSALCKARPTICSTCVRNVTSTVPSATSANRSACMECFDARLRGRPQERAHFHCRHQHTGLGRHLHLLGRRYQSIPQCASVACTLPRPSRCSERAEYPVIIRFNFVCIFDDPEDSEDPSPRVSRIAHQALSPSVATSNIQTRLEV